MYLFCFALRSRARSAFLLTHANFPAGEAHAHGNTCGDLKAAYKKNACCGKDKSKPISDLGNYDGSNTDVGEYPPFANSPLAKYSRNAFSMGLAGLPASCTHTNFGQKVDDSCCDTSSAIMSVPIQQAYGDYTVLPQGQVFQDGRGTGIYFNCPRDAGELDLGAVCLMKRQRATRRRWPLMLLRLCRFRTGCFVTKEFIS